MNRRQFLSWTTAATGLMAMPRVRAQWEPSPRYPDPRIRILDESFARYRIAQAKVERIATGMRWCEGPVWFGDARQFLWSDIPNNRIMKWEEETGAVSVFRQPSNNANGNTRDRQGRLLTCEPAPRRVTRTEHDGTITVIADRFDGKPLNAPNDIVCRSDGSIWFSDPYSALGAYGNQFGPAQLPSVVYRWDPQSRALSVVAGDLARPNGLAFSADESKLYIIDYAANPRVIVAYDVTAGGTSLAGKRALITAERDGAPDGMRVDVDGNLWVGWGGEDGKVDGVSIFNPDGRLIGRIDLPERCANLCFGGLHRNRLFMCASTSVFTLFVNTQGVAGG